MYNELNSVKPIKINGHTIKPISKYQDFSDIIEVFAEPPYGEPLTEYDKIEEYMGYIMYGGTLGYYNEQGEIMGYIGVMEEIENDHKEYFHESIQDLKPLYIYGVATKKEHRGLGICSKLVELMLEIAKQKGIDFMYARINNVGSMSESIFHKHGFSALYQNGEKVIQDVSAVQDKQSENTLPEANERSFVLIPLTEIGQKALTLTGAIAEEEPKVEKTYKIKF